MTGEHRHAVGTSGRRLAIAIVLIGTIAGAAALFFRQHMPRMEPATRPDSATQPAL
jgi:hypothetical protein